MFLFSIYAVSVIVILFSIIIDYFSCKDLYDNSIKNYLFVNFDILLCTIFLCCIPVVNTIIALFFINSLYSCYKNHKKYGNQ